MRRLFFLFIISLSCIHSSFSASINCKKAIRPQEELVCTTRVLSDTDTELAATYKNALVATDNPLIVKKSQRIWLKNIQDECKDNVDCLFDAYQARITELQEISGIISNIPSNTSVTGIESVITPRNTDGTYPVWVSPELGLKSL